MSSSENADPVMPSIENLPDSTPPALEHRSSSVADSDRRHSTEVVGWVVVVVVGALLQTIGTARVGMIVREWAVLCWLVCTRGGASNTVGSVCVLLCERRRDNVGVTK